VPFVAVVQTAPDGQRQFVRLRQQAFTAEEVSVFAARSIDSSATVCCDGLWPFGAAQIVGADPGRVVTGGGKAGTQLPQLNSWRTTGRWGFLKGPLSGAYNSFEPLLGSDKLLARELVLMAVEMGVDGRSYAGAASTGQ
jgi:hypothetical protein